MLNEQLVNIAIEILQSRKAEVTFIEIYFGNKDSIQISDKDIDE